MLPINRALVANHTGIAPVAGRYHHMPARCLSTSRVCAKSSHRRFEPHNELESLNSPMWTRTSFKTMILQPPVDDQQHRVRARLPPPNRMTNRTDQCRPNTDQYRQGSPLHKSECRDSTRISGLNEPSSRWFSPSITLTSPSSLGWTPYWSHAHQRYDHQSNTTNDSSLKAITPFNQRRMGLQGLTQHVFEAVTDTNELIDHQRS